MGEGRGKFQCTRSCKDWVPVSASPASRLGSITKELEKNDSLHDDSQTRKRKLVGEGTQLDQCLFLAILRHICGLLWLL